MFTEQLNHQTRASLLYSDIKEILKRVPYYSFPQFYLYEFAVSYRHLSDMTDRCELLFSLSLATTLAPTTVDQLNNIIRHSVHGQIEESM